MQIIFLLKSVNDDAFDELEPHEQRELVLDGGKAFGTHQAAMRAAVRDWTNVWNEMMEDVALMLPVPIIVWHSFNTEDGSYLEGYPMAPLPDMTYRITSLVVEG